MNFYEPNSDEYYLESDEWATDRQMLVRENCDLLKVEQRRINLICEHFFMLKVITILNLRLIKILIISRLPYELGDELDNGLDAGDICMKIIEENLKGDILIASTDRDKCCFIQCSTVNESVIYQLGQIHINTPFIHF